jgi:hypothetical protein
LDFPEGTTRRDLTFDHGIILTQLFSLLRGSHEGSGFTKVIFPQALVVLGGDLSGLVFEFQVLQVLIDHQAASLQIPERSDIHGQSGIPRAFRRKQWRRDESRQP